MTPLFSNKYYEVNLTPEPIPVDTNGVTLFFNYYINNTHTGRSEGYAQFLPAAIEQASVLNKGLKDLLGDTSSNAVAHLVQ